MSDAPYRTITYEVSEGVATVTLNRPERLNAFTTTMGRELVAAYQSADGDDAVRAVILTGCGRGFCAGADLQLGAKSFDAEIATKDSLPADAATIGGVPRDWGGVVSLAIAGCRKFTIAAINGPAMGVGVTMTLPMDVRIASRDARFGLVFARLGLVPEAASSWFLPRVVGISQALEWVATGRRFTAEEALEGGLVSRVVDGADLLVAAHTLAREVADNGAPVSVAASRAVMWAMLGEPNPWVAHRLESQLMHALGTKPDVAEGVRAVTEKSVPNFPGRVSSDCPPCMPQWPGAAVP